MNINGLTEVTELIKEKKYNHFSEIWKKKQKLYKVSFEKSPEKEVTKFWAFLQNLNTKYASYKMKEVE